MDETLQKRLKEAEDIINDGDGILLPLHIMAQFQNRGIEYSRPKVGEPRGTCCHFCENMVFGSAHGLGRHYCKKHGVVFGEVKRDNNTSFDVAKSLTYVLFMTEEFSCEDYEERTW